MLDISFTCNANSTFELIDFEHYGLKKTPEEMLFYMSIDEDVIELINIEEDINFTHLPEDALYQLPFSFGSIHI